MKNPLRILHLEEARRDVEQVRRTLEAEGMACDVQHVETAADFIYALDNGEFDLILSGDSSSPPDGLSVLAIARKKSPDTPLVVLSEALDDGIAKILLDLGATDYVLKARLSSLVAIIRRAVGESEIRRQNRRAEEKLHALHQINLAVASTSDLSVVLQIVLERIDDVFHPATAVDVRLVDKATGRVELIACRNVDEARWRAGPETIQHPVHRTILQSKSPLFVRNLQVDEQTSMRDFYRQQGFVSFLGLPLAVRGEVVGVLSWFTEREHEFSREEFEFARILARPVSVAIDNFQLHEQIGKLARNLVNDQKQIQVLSRGVIDAEHEEARRIARVLRDESGQLVAGVYNTLEKIAKAAPASIKQQVAKAKKLLDELGERLRSLSHEFHPTILDDRGLMPSLELLAEQMSKRNGFRITIEGQLNQRLSPFVELALYHVVQEALNNVARHAQATKARIRLFQNKNSIHCSIHDNGIGFETKEIAGRTGKRTAARGLARMGERAVMLGGQLTIDSAPGTGTVLTAEFPVRSEVAGAQRPATLSTGRMAEVQR